MFPIIKLASPSIDWINILIRGRRPLMGPIRDIIGHEQTYLLQSGYWLAQ